MTNSQHFAGTKAFIALRPDIFGHKDEHVTVEYLGHYPEWNSMLEKIQDWETRFGLEKNPNCSDESVVPLRVFVNGYANWCAKDEYHHVALVGFDGLQELSFSKNWHITLESSPRPIESYTFDKDADAFRFDNMTELWIGYKDRTSNDRKWISARNAKKLVRSMDLELV